MALSTSKPALLYNRASADIPLVVVAGSRNFKDYGLFCRYLDAYLETAGDCEFVSGKAPDGADDMIIRYARERGYICREMPAAWDNIDVKGAVVKKNKRGQLYNAVAGHQRNEEMAQIGTHLLLFWDGASKGSMDMLTRADQHGLKINVVLVDVVPEIAQREQVNGTQHIGWHVPGVDVPSEEEEYADAQSNWCD